MDFRLPRALGWSGRLAGSAALVALALTATWAAEGTFTVPTQPLPPGRRPVTPALATTNAWIRADLARRMYGLSGAGMVVAVVDTGAYIAHVDLAGRQVAGRNFLSGADPNDTSDPSGHGTAVTGIACANGDHIGIAPGARFVTARVFDASGTISSEIIADALEWIATNAATYGITAVNMSLGHGNYNGKEADPEWQYYATTPQIVHLTQDMGIPICASAGNSFLDYSKVEGMDYPAIHRNCISVAAGSNVSDAFWEKSQRLSSVVGGTYFTTIVAPGTATWTTGTAGPHDEAGWEGTSMAAPVVSGVVMLVQEYYKRLHGTLPTPVQIKQWLRDGAVTLHDTVTGHDFLRVDAVGAIEAVGGRTGHRPDLLVRPTRSDGMVGDNDYCDDPAGQSTTVAASSSVPASFVVRMQNDGTVSDRLRLRYLPGRSSLGGYSVRIVDDSTGLDMTAAVLNGGFVTANLASGQSKDLRVEISPPEGVGVSPAAAGCNLALGLSSEGNALRYDNALLVGAVAADLPVLPPDATISATQGGPAIGAGVYDPTGATECLAQSGTGGKLTYWLSVTNPASPPSGTPQPRQYKVMLVNRPDPDRTWDVRYWYVRPGYEDVDITGTATLMGWPSPSIPIGSTMWIKLEVTPRGSSPSGVAERVITSFTPSPAPSPMQDAYVDAVQAVMALNASFGLDASVKRSDQATYTGGGTVADSATGQTVTGSATESAAQEYTVRLQNLSPAADSIWVAAPTLPVGWTLAASEVSSGKPITSDLQANTYRTPDISAGGEFLLRATVKPPAGTGYGTRRALELRAVSGLSGTIVDRVAMLTGAGAFVSPDLQYRVGSADPWDGVGEYDPAGVTTQVLSRRVLPGEVAEVRVRTVNDSPAALQGGVTLSAPAGWEVHAYDAAGGAEITSAVLAGTWRVPLTNGASHEVRLTFKAPEAAALGGVTQVTLTTTSDAAHAPDHVLLRLTSDDADLTDDGAVDDADLAAFAQAWRRFLAGTPVTDRRIDINGDGKLTTSDAASYLQIWLAQH
jgi:hypothetical protein